MEEALIELLNSSKNDQLRLVCCRALGQIAGNAGVEALLKVLVPKKILFFRRRQNARLREAAALALEEISHSKAVQGFARFINDNDRSVREVVRRVVDSAIAAESADAF